MTLKTRTEAEALLVEVLDLHSPLADVRLDGQITPTGDHPLCMSGSTARPVPNYGDFRGEGESARLPRDSTLESTPECGGAGTARRRSPGADQRDPPGRPPSSWRWPT